MKDEAVQAATPNVADSVLRAYCRKCGYALTGLGGGRVCPECGRVFDPADPRSMARRPPRGSVWRWGRRVAVLLLLVSVAAAIGYWRLARGWAAEQPARDAGRTMGVGVQYRMIGDSAWLELAMKMVGRTQLLDRVESIQIEGLSASQVGGLRFGDLPYLYSLVVIDSPVDPGTMARIGRLDGLHNLSLVRTGVRGAALAPLGALRSLTFLSLDGVEMDDAAMSDVRRLTGLRVLRLGDDALVTDVGLVEVGMMTQLEHFAVSGTLITDAGLAHLSHLTGLRELHLLGTRAGPDGIRAIKAAIPRLRVYGRDGELGRW